MDFIFDNLLILIIVASGIVKWWTSTQEAKKERENPQPQEEYDLEELEDFAEQAEGRYSAPAVPPPLPPGDVGPMPGVERSSVPALRRKSSEPPSFDATSGVEEELARQSALAEQLSGLKQARKARTAKVASGGRKKSNSAFATGSLRSRLKNRRELRQAFVVKEILDKPIGLR
jgi:hypothetical protein